MTILSSRPARTRAANEADALQRVVTRLRTQFPELDEQQIERAVAGKYECFDQSPIRDFIPILVERSARSDLEQATASHRGV